MDEWRTRLPGDRHRGDVAALMRALLDGAPQATLAKLSALLEAYRARCEAAGTCRMFNKVKSHVQSFLRATAKRSHPLYKQVRDVGLLPVTPKRAKHPQSPDKARTIAAVLGGEAGRVWWTPCCTGIGPDEYFGGNWRVEDGLLHVLGTKRRGRNRQVPLLVTPEPPMLTYWGFREALRRSGLGVALYDARRTFANWMEQAELWETHQQGYLGHGSKTVTDLYRWHDLTWFLERDRKILLGFIGGISGGTAKAPKAGSSSAPPVNRTRNLLIERTCRSNAGSALTSSHAFVSAASAPSLGTGLDTSFIEATASRIIEGEKWAWRSVVLMLRCPARFWITRRGTPAIARWLQKVWRRVGMVTLSGKSLFTPDAATASLNDSWTEPHLLPSGKGGTSGGLGAGEQQCLRSTGTGVPASS